MRENYDNLEPEVQAHIRNLVKTAEVEDSDDALELFSAGWLEKQRSFFEQTKQRELEEVDELDADDPRGALIMTYSGSLINIGPEQDDFRSVDYFSIGLRNDVPESATEEASVLESSVEKGKPVRFKKGPILQSSSVYSIAVVRAEMTEEEETELLDEVTMLIAEDFASINKTTIQEI